mgnify:CR=1 FL=1
MNENKEESESEDPQKVAAQKVDDTVMQDREKESKPILNGVDPKDEKKPVSVLLSVCGCLLI